MFSFRKDDVLVLFQMKDRNMKNTKVKSTDHKYKVYHRSSTTTILILFQPKTK